MYSCGVRYYNAHPQSQARSSGVNTERAAYTSAPEGAAYTSAPERAAYTSASESAADTSTSQRAFCHPLYITWPHPLPLSLLCLSFPFPFSPSLAFRSRVDSRVFAVRCVFTPLGTTHGCMAQWLSVPSCLLGFTMPGDVNLPPLGLFAWVR